MTSNCAIVAPHKNLVPTGEFTDLLIGCGFVPNETIKWHDGRYTYDSPIATVTVAKTGDWSYFNNRSCKTTLGCGVGALAGKLKC